MDSFIRNTCNVITITWNPFDEGSVNRDLYELYGRVIDALDNKWTYRYI
jgi:hypothetical protein